MKLLFTLFFLFPVSAWAFQDTVITLDNPIPSPGDTNVTITSVYPVSNAAAAAAVPTWTAAGKVTTITAAADGKTAKFNVPSSIVGDRTFTITVTATISETPAITVRETRTIRIK